LARERVGSDDPSAKVVELRGERRGEARLGVALLLGKLVNLPRHGVRRSARTCASASSTPSCSGRKARSPRGRLRAAPSTRCGPASPSTRPTSGSSAAGAFLGGFRTDGAGTPVRKNGCAARERSGPPKSQARSCRITPARSGCGRRTVGTAIP
jgi:hypothetical protein